MGGHQKTLFCTAQSHPGYFAPLCSIEDRTTQDRTTMNKLLLLAPESVCSSLSDIEGITPEPLPEQSTCPWMELSQISPLAGSHFHVAVTSNSDAAVIREMFGTLNDLSGNFSIAIICTDEPLPAGLRSVLPECLHPLLRRPRPRDLCVAATQSLQSSIAGTVLELSLTPGTTALALSNGAASDRFPSLGPQTPEIVLTCLQTALKAAPGLQQLGPLNHRCVESGLLLLWDFLDESHHLSQTMEGTGSPRTGDYWHGIMHRREPDAGNASYWFRRVGRHPALGTLGQNLIGWMCELGATSAQRDLVQRKLLTAGAFDPFAMIQMAEKAMLFPDSEEELTCRMVQYLEILNLLAWSFENG